MQFLRLSQDKNHLSTLLTHSFSPLLLHHLRHCLHRVIETMGKLDHLSRVSELDSTHCTCMFPFYIFRLSPTGISMSLLSPLLRLPPPLLLLLLFPPVPIFHLIKEASGFDWFLREEEGGGGGEGGGESIRKDKRGECVLFCAASKEGWNFHQRRQQQCLEV